MTKKDREKAITKGIQSLDIRPANESRFKRPPKDLASAGRSFFARSQVDQKDTTAQLPQPEAQEQNKELGADPQSKELRASPQSLELGPSPKEELRASPQSLELPVSPSFDPPPLKKSQPLGPRGQPPAISESTPGIPLAPLQWRVWDHLLSLKEGDVRGYGDIAPLVGGKRQGVKKAVARLKNLGGITAIKVVQEKHIQGIQVQIDRSRRFYEVPLDMSKGLSRRGRPLDLGVSPQSFGTARMYVKEIKYIPDLLLLLPFDWNIREQTIKQLIQQFPAMTLLELRRSLRYLIEQAKSGPAIQNYNAWLKGAFEKNGGPLVTEQEIEARLDQKEVKARLEQPKRVQEEEVQDLEILHSYVAASAEEKALIDQLAEERVEQMLERVSADKHAGIREQARIECAREFFAERRK